MKLKPQPRPTRRPPRKPRPARRASGVRPAGRQARRPGTPLRRRLAGRLPSIRRVLAGVGAVAVAAGLIALLNGPWLRVSQVTWAGERWTSGEELASALVPAQGASVLAVDTAALADRLRRLPSVAEATVAASLTGSIEATVVERDVAFVWHARSTRFLGAANGTIFAAIGDEASTPDELAAIPVIHDARFAARLVSVGDIIPAEILDTAMRLVRMDPAALGSRAERLSVSLDDEYGFRLASTDPEWEVALGVYGLDPTETASEAAARLERQVTAVRTLFATESEGEIGWVDVRNPGKVYFRAKG